MLDRKPVILYKLGSFQRSTLQGVVAQSVRVLACHARGRGFEPRLPRHLKNLGE